MAQAINQHLTSFDAMRFLDDEMSDLERSDVSKHLLECESCNQLVAKTRDTLSFVSTLASPALDVERDSDRFRLEAALSEIASTRKKRRRFLQIFGHRRKTFAYTAAILVAALSVHTAMRWLSPQKADLQNIALLPDRALTPGAVRTVSLGELCSVPDDDDLDPSVAQPTRNAVFHEYGIAAEREKRYFQVDYLINPQLGGVDDVRNLWPQPYTSEWNAEAKDALERRLHQMVCEKKIELADAQREIAENWIDAYKKYFHTSKPI
jgi:hypothetical protein